MCKTMLYRDHHISTEKDERGVQPNSQALLFLV